MSINNDIRLRSKNYNRFFAVLVVSAISTLALTFSLSFLPSYAKAAWFWNPHNNHENNSLYAQCHNHLDDNDGNGIDMQDPACAEVDNDIPEIFNQSLVTTVDTATSTTLEVVDADDDLLYFEVTQIPANGTLSVLPATAFTLDALPTITYTPNPGYVGTDSFNVKVSDGFPGLVDEVGQVATISITVNAAVVTCEEGQHLDQESNTCVNNTPTVPECTATQHLEENVCVENPAPETPSNTNTGSSGNGGGNGGGGPVISGPLSIGFVNTNNGGVVLGASTELPASCSAYLTAYLKKGSTNSSEVKKLQQFLNKHMGTNLPVTGIFGQLTFNAVSKFQEKYSGDVLKPWFEKKLSGDMNSSGYVYKTTLFKINMIECATLNAPAPQLP